MSKRQRTSPLAALCQKEVFRRSVEFVLSGRDSDAVLLLETAGQAAYDCEWLRLALANDQIDANDDDDDPRALMMRAFRRHGPGEERISLLTRAAESNCSLAAAYLGKEYYSGSGVLADDEMARHWLLRAGEEGGALYLLGRMSGDNPEFMARAAALDHPEAQRFLALHHKKNNRALEFIQIGGQAALNGSTAAQLLLRSYMMELWQTDEQHGELNRDHDEILILKRQLGLILQHNGALNLYERTLFGEWASEEELYVAQQMQ